MKKEFKILFIMLSLIIAFAKTNVFAEDLLEIQNTENQEEIKENIWTFENFKNLFKNITLDIKESEVYEISENHFDDSKLKELINEKINQKLIDNNITFPLVIEEKIGTVTINGISISNLGKEEIETGQNRDIHYILLNLNTSNCQKFENDNNYCSSQLYSKITYSNTKDYDENIANEVAKKLNTLTYEIKSVDFKDIFNYLEIETIPSEETVYNIKSKINDDSIDIAIIFNMGGGSPSIKHSIYAVQLFKNDVYYGETNYEVIKIGKIVIPNNISDNDLESYSISKIREIMPEEEYGQITSLKKINSIGGAYGEENDQLVSDFYIIEGTDFAVQLQREQINNSNDEDTNLNNNIVSTNNPNITITEEKISTDNEVFIELQSKIINTVYKDIVGAFEITSKNEINDKLTLTFNVGKEHNNRQALVLHKKSNGEIEEFTCVVTDGVITIEVTELSPFMIALGDKVEEKTNNANTGTTDIVLYGTIAIFALGGMIYTIKKKNI